MCLTPGEMICQLQYRVAKEIRDIVLPLLDENQKLKRQLAELQAACDPACGD